MKITKKVGEKHKKPRESSRAQPARRAKEVVSKSLRLHLNSENVSSKWQIYPKDDEIQKLDDFHQIHSLPDNGQENQVGEVISSYQTDKER